ncbi:MAG: hypothetical protein V4714_16215 [Bacteroidota bacterium]
MRKGLLFIHLKGSFLLLWSLLVATGCCREQATEIRGLPLSDSEKAWVPYNSSDTIKFIDQNKHTYFATVSHTFNGDFGKCLENCCNSCACSGRISERWDTRYIAFKTNIQLLNQQPLNIKVQLEAAVKPTDASHLLISIGEKNGDDFSQFNPQLFNTTLDKTANSSLNEFGWAGNQEFQGLRFSDVYYQKYLEKRVSPSYPAIDTVYLNKDKCLIRFTTTTGDSYTRYN